MRNRTGLAMEAAAHAKSSSGIKVTNRVLGGAEITDTRVSEVAAKNFGMRCGRYISIEASPRAEIVCALLKRGMEQLIPPKGTVLIAGIGNAAITQDSLGPRVASLLSPMKGKRYRVRVISAAVSAKTGVETAAMVRAAADAADADFVIAVDALACEDVSRIGRTVQMTDAGIVPGAGASAASGELSEESLGIPCVAVGVPTVAELSSVTQESDHNGLLISTSDCDTMIQLWAEVVAAALSSALR